MPIPFPVDRTYRIRADVQVLSRRRRRDAHEPDVVAAAPSDDEALAAKLEALAAASDHVRAWAPRVDGAACGAALAALLTEATRCVPDRVQWDGRSLTMPALGVRVRLELARLEAGPALLDARGATPVGRRVAAQICAARGRDRVLDAVALALGEDVVVVSGDAPGGCLEALHVCQPSGWSASDKAGMTFAAAHDPVPHAEPLMEGGPDLVDMLTSRGPFVRYVWGLHTDEARCHDPHVHTPAPVPAGASPADVAATTWFRVERQTTIPVPDARRALFLIRVDAAPLPAVITSSARAELLAASLRDMTPELVRYKGLRERHAPLLSWLDAQALAD